MIWVAIAGLALSVSTIAIMLLGPFRSARAMRMGCFHIELFVLAVSLNAIQSAAAFETLAGNTGALLAFCNWWGIPLLERLIWLGVAFHLTNYYLRLSEATGRAEKHIAE